MSEDTESIVMERNCRHSCRAGRAQVRTLLTLLLLVLVGLLLFREARFWFGGVHHEGAAPRAVTARGDLAVDEQSTIQLFKAVSPSVVSITSVAVQQDWFRFRALDVPRGAGSSFIWDSNGYIVTNYHVIAEAQCARQPAIGPLRGAGIRRIRPQTDDTQDQGEGLSAGPGRPLRRGVRANSRGITAPDWGTAPARISSA